MASVFVRNWWIKTATGRKPGPGRKTYIARGVSEAEALELCREYNSTHEPGYLSRKAEWED